ncbi:MAG: exodeoxyribonuclease V subunit gamma [bacterium]|nr:exodeoxyribonuclease V subunit gamma [bacterium]
MALQFIFGNSGAGKSHYLYEHIIEESMRHPKQNYIVIVPEQFTMQTQKEFVMRHPRHGIMNIDVLSFQRLAFRVLEEIGEGNRVVLDDEGKNFVLRKVAGRLAPELHVLGSNIRKPGYISEVKSVISELMQYNILPADMEEMKDAVEKNSYSYYKLQDIQMLYQEFENYLKDKYITKDELLDLLCLHMDRSRILKDAVVALDGFTGFTPVQNKVLAEMLVCCQKVFVTVTIDRSENPFVLEDKYQIFALSKKMAIALKRICEEQRIEVEEPVCLYQEPTYRFQNQPALAFLESELFRLGQKKYKEKQQNIRIYVSRNPREEVEFAAQRIRALVRKRGYRYQDIAVIVSDMNLYADDIERIFARYEIPVFMDYKRSLLLNSFVEYIRSLLAMIEKNFSYESVFRFLRTGLTGFSGNEIDILENYVRGLGIRGYKKWQEKWIRRTGEMAEEMLEIVNRMRVEFVEKVDPLVFVLKQRHKTVKDVTLALYEFIEQEKMYEKIRQMELSFQEAGESALAKEYAQVYGVVIGLFDKFVQLLGEERISLKEYCDLLDAGMNEARIGIIPPGIDQVMAGDIERTRLKDIKALIMLGVNDALISPGVGSQGLLSENDREKFEEKGLELAPGVKEKAFIQKYYLYLHLSKPTEELNISYSKLTQDGKSARPAYLIGELRKMFVSLPVFDMETYGMEYREMLPRTGMDYLIQGLRDQKLMETAGWQELYRWYRKQPEWQERVEQLKKISLYKKPEDGLTRETAEKLYGEWDPSISRMEQFVSCACAHFLTYGLRLKEREEYEFAALDFGNVIHKALEHYAKKLEQNQDTWTSVDTKRQQQYIEESVEESIVDYSNTVLYSTARNAYMIPRMKRLMRRTIWAMTQQLKKGAFVPESYEANFTYGKIDRIDVCETEDEVYVKIVDYKTGSKSFDMSAFYHGLQMQLVVYMNEALKLEERKHPGKKAVPAGIFYYRMKDPIVAKEEDLEKIESAILKELRMDGLVNSEEAIIQRLDDNFTGSSDVIPVARTKTGFARYSKTLSGEEFSEVLEFAEEKRRELKREMNEGNVDAFPYEMGQQTGCDYCEYRDICGFDETIPGYEYRRLGKLSKEEVLEKIHEDAKRRKNEWE